LEGLVTARAVMRGTVLALALAAVVWGALRPAGQLRIGTPTAERHAPPLVLPDDRGGVFDLVTQHGKAVLVTFGYTRCPDVCPTTLAFLQDAISRLGPDAARVCVVFVTLDPGQDTPSVLKDYLSAFPPEPIGLSGTPEAVANAARAWGVTWRRTENGFIDHSEVVVVVGPDGRERLRFGFAQLGDAAAVAHDVESVLHDG